MPRPSTPGTRARGGPRSAGKAMGIIPREYKPPRDRTVKVKDAVACPVCKAEVGVHCHGLLNGAFHLPRRRMALRKERGEA